MPSKHGVRGAAPIFLIRYVIVEVTFIQKEQRNGEDTEDRAFWRNGHDWFAYRSRSGAARPPGDGADAQSRARADGYRESEGRAGRRHGCRKRGRRGAWPGRGGERV